MMRFLVFGWCALVVAGGAMACGAEKVEIVAPGEGGGGMGGDETGGDGGAGAIGGAGGAEPEFCDSFESCEGDACPNLMWGHGFPVDRGDHGVGAATGPDGEVLLATTRRGAVDFGGGSTPDDIGASLVKLDANGSHVWTSEINANSVGGVVVDDEGRTIVAADALGATIEVFDADGAQQWAKTFSGGSSTRTQAIAVDGADGSIVIAGYFDGTLSFGATSLSSADNDIFIAKIDVGGDVLWARQYGGAGSDQPYALDVGPDGEIAMTGFFEGAIDFGSGVVSPDARDGFVVVLDAAGEHRWNRTFGGAGGQYGYAVAIAPAGDVWLGSAIGGGVTVDFGGGPLTNAPGWGIGLAKYDVRGDHLSSELLGTDASEQPWSLDVDPCGNVIMAGYYEGNTSLGGVSLGSPDGEESLFVLKLDQEGATIWAAGFGATGAQYARSLAVDSVGNIVVAGWYQQTFDLGGQRLPPATNQDVFVAKLAP